MTNRNIHPLTLLSRATKLSFTNIWRNKFLSLATIIVIAIILFIFNIILAIDFTGKTLINQATQKIDLVIYLDNDIGIFQGNEMVAELEKLQSVESATFRSKEEALEVMRQTSPKIVESIERNQLDNPLPPDIKIVTNSIDKHADIIAFVQRKYADRLHPVFNKLVTENSQNILAVAEQNEKIQESTSEKVLQFVRDTKQILFWTVLIFLIGGILIMMNAIQLTIFNRQKEIEVMKLVGATHSFIRLPYLIEGVIYAAAAVSINIIITLTVSTNLELTSIKNLALPQYISIFGYELIITIILGIFSSYFIVKKYLDRV